MGHNSSDFFLIGELDIDLVNINVVYDWALGPFIGFGHDLNGILIVYVLLSNLF